jgi:MFS family permease
MLADKIGRKKSIILSDFLTIIGPLVCLLAPIEIGVVCVARFFLGVGLGVSMMVS